MIIRNEEGYRELTQHCDTIISYLKLPMQQKDWMQRKRAATVEEKKVRASEFADAAEKIRPSVVWLKQLRYLEVEGICELLEAQTREYSWIAQDVSVLEYNYRFNYLYERLLRRELELQMFEIRVARELLLGVVRK